MKNQKANNSGLVQFIKFAIVGIGNTAVDWVIYYILVATALTDSKSLAKAISFLVALANSYLFNTIWTFKAEYRRLGSDSRAKQEVMIKFFAVGLVGWAINYFVFKATLPVYDPVLAGKHDILPLVFASGAAILWNFFANKLWTYKK